MSNKTELFEAMLRRKAQYAEDCWADNVDITVGEARGIAECMEALWKSGETVRRELKRQRPIMNEVATIREFHERRAARNGIDCCCKLCTVFDEWLDWDPDDVKKEGEHDGGA